MKSVNCSYFIDADLFILAIFIQKNEEKKIQNSIKWCECKWAHGGCGTLQCERRCRKSQTMTDPYRPSLPGPRRATSHGCYIWVGWEAYGCLLCCLLLLNYMQIFSLWCCVIILWNLMPPGQVFNGFSSASRT